MLTKDIFKSGAAVLRDFLHAKKASVLICCGCWAAVGLFVVSSDLGRTLEYQIARQAEFVFRDLLNLSPQLDPRVKIFGYDDKAIAALKSPDISLSDWTGLLHALNARKPRAVLVDKIFGFIPESESADLQKFINELKNEKNTALGAFLHTNVIPQRPTLELEREEFMLDNFMNIQMTGLPWLPIKNMQVYGPQKDIAMAAGRIGQILYPGFGSVAPWIRVSESRAVPHLGLAVASEVVMTSSGIILDGASLPLDRRGLIQVNFTSLAEYYKRARSMRSLIVRSREVQPIEEVNEGDVIVLLPLMYTGNFDVLESPLGRIPAGFIHASMASSILKGEWLRPMGNPYLMMGVLVVLGTILGGIAGAVRFWPIFLSVLTVGVGGSLSGFAYFGLVFPWLFPLAGFAAAALTMYGISVFELHERSRRLNDALNGLMPKHKLKDLIDGKSILTREPCEHVVTVMFLDIANFSAAAQERTPKDVFFQLKSIMNRVTIAVHKYGGTVDRTLGDGLLCFFGYSYDGSTNTNHADSAIACGREIQRSNVLKCIEDGKGTDPILPFRIGINTASAFIGDLGNSDRIDFTLIGNGVNLAQRLEAASDHHSMMVSLTTFDLSTLYNVKSEGVSRRKIKIKHHEELVDCVELDPLIDIPDQRQAAVKILRQRLSLNRGEQRWPVSGKVGMTFETMFGTASLVDFSKSGLCVALPTFLARGVQLAIEIKSEDQSLYEELRNEGLLKFRAEVRWGRPKDRVFIHGIQFIDINEGQQGAFLEIMRKHCVHENSNVAEFRRVS